MGNNIIRSVYRTIIPLEKRTTFSCRRKIKKSIKANPDLKNSSSKQYINHVISFWKQRYGINVKPYWHIAYASVNNKKDENYVPEDVLFTKIIPKWNAMDMKNAYSDKNAYSKIFKNTNEPKAILRNMNGLYFDSEYRKIEKNEADAILAKFNKEFIVKPSIDSGGVD